MRWLLATVILLIASIPVDAQGGDDYPRCGDLELVFRNPDLKLQADNAVHAGGQFFIQFQAIGPDAAKIETFGFSFGPDTIPFDETACDAPIWFTGPYVMNYRADRDPSDGFFIPLKTDLVPDGTYAAAVHAYDGQNNELARFWTRAVVNNCPGDPPARCTDQTEQQTPFDSVAPWPIVLPGDGVPMEGRHLSVEFAEPVTDLVVKLNGEDITANMTEWEGRVWDADYFPDYGPAGVGNAVAPPCTQDFHTCIKYGPAWEWNGRALTADDIVRVEATDMNGNTAAKDLHIGSGVAGGAVTSAAPNLEITVSADELTTTATSPVVFRFDMQNNGGGDAHPFTSVDSPNTWSAEFLPHEPVPAGGRTVQELTVTPPGTALPGTYDVNATISWPSQGIDQERTWRLKVVVDGETKLVTDPDDETANEDAKESPGAAPLLLALAFVALAALVRRREPVG